MSLTTSEMTPADIAAVTGGGNYGGGWNNGSDSWWIILFLILAMGGNWGPDGNNQCTFWSAGIRF